MEKLFPSGAEGSGEERSLPTGFRKFHFGLSRRQTEDFLKDNSFFRQFRPPELTFLNNPRRDLLTIYGKGFVKKGNFLFYKDRLFSIEILLNSDRMDYFRLFDTLFRKYGKPQTMNPKTAVWKSKETRLSLEFPLTLKYIDRKVFQEITRNDDQKKTATEESRKAFLKEL